jgi:Tol biopolymer transport system component
MYLRITACTVLSRDGRTLVYAGFAPEAISIRRIPAEGGGPLQIAKEEVATEPDISPDGKRVAAIGMNSPMPFLVSPFEGGTVVKRLPFPDGSPDIMKWSPDGLSLTYIRTQAGNSNLWRQPLTGAPPSRSRILRVSASLHFAWAPDGRLAMARAANVSDVALIRGFAPQ